MFDDKRDRGRRDGREARTALPVSPRLKATLAAGGAVLCAGLAALAWFLGPTWLAVPLAALAAWAALDVGWQWRKTRRRRA